MTSQTACAIRVSDARTAPTLGQSASPINAIPPYATSARDCAARTVRDPRATKPTITKTIATPPSTNHGAMPMSAPATTKALATGIATQATHRNLPNVT